MARICPTDRATGDTSTLLEGRTLSGRCLEEGYRLPRKTREPRLPINPMLIKICLIGSAPAFELTPLQLLHIELRGTSVVPRAAGYRDQFPF
ncbi:MAG: hypothetical protein RL417_2025 [Pseudomonadota bacterium]